MHALHISIVPIVYSFPLQCILMYKNVLIYNYILIRKQLSNLVKLFKLLHILFLCNEYLCIHYYVQIQVKFEHTKKVIRNINRIRTDNTMP